MRISQIQENVIKMKGVTLDVANLNVVTFEAVKKMVLDNEEIKNREAFLISDGLIRQRI